MDRTRQPCDKPTYFYLIELEFGIEADWTLETMPGSEIDFSGSDGFKELNAGEVAIVGGIGLEYFDP